MTDESDNILERDFIDWNGRTLETETIQTDASGARVGRTWGIFDEERDVFVTVHSKANGYCSATIESDGMIGKAEGAAVTYDGLRGALDEALRNWRRFKEAWGA